MATSFYTSHHGVMFVSPGGQSEQGSSVAGAGYTWAAINIGDGQGWDSWWQSIAQFKAAQMRVPVWGRVKNSSVEAILGQAIAHHSPSILNIEDEFKTRSPASFEKAIRTIRAQHPGYTRETVISTVGWLYNDVDYRPMARRPFLLQVFLDDMHLTPDQLPKVTADCISHAKSKGLRDVGVTFQCYGSAESEWYSFWGSRPRSLFSGDTVGAKQAWPEWRVV